MASDRYPELVHEVRLIRVHRAPTSRRLHRLLRWRWDVTTYEPRVTQHPGVYDGRNGAQHRPGCGFGYTFTRWGALRRIAHHTTAV
ncbi:hypothetical protein [Streptomyces swartbergensis]|uniref:Uncharacterized protein n=1 Tax=Streptomyces swartbergensis TaxID=487165 RepID=A0A243SAE7_9ACTN|nr:hypothetical protein [Streptomyces swartbergensis]OUD04683.1 hypothetical protein CA983_02705 [Streptomyces swartbergensis]